MDINNINDVAYAWASHERNEANRGKGVRSKGWVTKEQMRKDAAQKALGIMIAIAALTILVSIFIKIFGKVTGTIMMIVLVLGFPICYLIQESTGYNIQWLPLWIVAFALALKLFTKMFGRKWGLRIGIPIVGIIALIAYHRDEPSMCRLRGRPKNQLLPTLLHKFLHSNHRMPKRKTNMKKTIKISSRYLWITQEGNRL